MANGKPPRPIVTGSPAEQRRRIRVSYDPAQGVTTTTEYEGVMDACSGLTADLQSRGIAYDLTLEGNRSRLVSTQGRNNFIEETSVERWELLSNQQQLDVKEHPNVVAIGTALVRDVILQVEKHLSGKASDTTGFNADQLALFNLLIRGINHYSAPQWVLRYTANISNEYQFLTEANSGIGTIYTNAQAAAAVPAGRMRSTIQSITAPAADSYLTWGWLKTAVTETVAARNRIDVSAEYWLAQWPILLYS